MNTYYGFEVRHSYGEQVQLGQKVYMIFGQNWSFVVEAYVNDVTLILQKKDSDESRWFAIGGGYDPKDSIAIPPENKDEWVIVNHWYWIDEPAAGHAIYDKGDGVFTSLQEALKNANPWKSCRHHHVRKMLTKHRSSWLSKSKVDSESPTWSPIPKKVWVRRK